MIIPSTAKAGLVCLGVGALLGTGAGLAMGWKIYRTAPASLPPPQVAIQNTDGSTTLATQPNPSAKPPHHAPGTVTDIVHLQVQPLPPVAGMDPTNGSSPVAPGSPSAGNPCPPVTIDLSLSEMPDGSHRVTVSSPNGQILGESSIHVPVRSSAVPKDLRRALGYVGNFRTRHGVFYDQDFGPFRAGVEVVRETLPAKINYQINAKLGIRF